MVAVVLSQVVAHNEELRRHNRHIGPSMLIGAAGLAAVAETARPIEEPLANGRGRQEQHSMRIKRSDIEFEIDEAMVLRVAAMDESGCGARLLCELHQEEPAQLNGTIARRLVQIFESVETSVKLFHHFNDYDYDCYFLFFSGQQPPNFEALRTEPKAAFQYAAFVGATSGKNLKTCPNVFDRCPFNARIILEVLNSRSAGFLSDEAESSSTVSPVVKTNW